MKTVLQQARIDLEALYGKMFGLSDSQKKLVDEWLETYLPKERQQIEQAVIDIAPKLAFMLPGDAKRLASDYFTTNYSTSEK